MTCGRSRFVFTVINALCNSLKTIKEADIGFIFILYSWLLVRQALNTLCISLTVEQA